MNFKQKLTAALLLAAFAVRADMQLTGVMISQAGSSALINGASYRVGDEVDGFTVVAIDGQSATLRRTSTGNETILTIGWSSNSVMAAKPAVKNKSQPAAQMAFGAPPSSGRNQMPPAVAGFAAAVTAFSAAWIGLALLFNLFMLVTWWKICSKAGQPGWSIFIPFYNIYVMLKIAGKPGWWMLLLFIPIVNIIISILVPLCIAQNFGKGGWFGLGLLFLPVIFYPMLAFGRAEYQG